MRTQSPTVPAQQPSSESLHGVRPRLHDAAAGTQHEHWAATVSDRLCAEVTDFKGVRRLTPGGLTEDPGWRNKLKSKYKNK